MAQPKFYAVAVGKATGIFTTWTDCNAQVHGYPGARFKSFPTKEEAEEYLAAHEDAKAAPTDGLIAYVDGSYDAKTKRFSYGMVVLQDGEEVFRDCACFADPVLAAMRNVAGELKGAEAAMRYGAQHGAERITIFHDYEGIAAWCRGDWKTNREGTMAYKAFYEEMAKKLTISFVKVQGHSGDRYNDLADELAKMAIRENIGS